MSCKVVFFVPDFLCVRYHENLGSRSEHVLNVLGAGFDLQKKTSQHSLGSVTKKGRVLNESRVGHLLVTLSFDNMWQCREHVGPNDEGTLLMLLVSGITCHSTSRVDRALGSHTAHFFLTPNGRGSYHWLHRVFWRPRKKAKNMCDTLCVETSVGRVGIGG